MIQVSVVVPFHDNRTTLGSCIDAVVSQNIARDLYEIIAVDDGSTDGSATIARSSGVHVITQSNRGAPAARNAGIAAATGNWVAFTDADCIPSRGWLRSLFAAVASRPGALGAAGSIFGEPSSARASRYVDISGGLDTQRHLSHPRFPFAPSGNVMYRKAALDAVGGFDERYSAYDSCDLHARLRSHVGGELVYCREAVVIHRHRETWPAYWRQQINYGRGLAQFYAGRPAEIDWSILRELGEWLALGPAAALACLPGDDDVALARRGSFVKRLAQRVGFAKTYFSAREKARWKSEWKPA